MTGSSIQHRNITSVGGLVVRDQELLVVRMTYGPTRGRYMLPGGLLDPGETLDQAVVREVREETAVEARPVGIAGVRSRRDGDNTDTYIVWLLDHLAGEPQTDSRENDDARFLPFAEILQRDEVAELVRYFTARIQAGQLQPHRFAEDYDHTAGNVSPASWKLFL